MNKHSVLWKYLYLFWFGGTCYVTFEVLIREKSHWTMLVLAGIIFIIVGLFNEIWTWEAGLIKQIIVGVIIAVSGEFITGCIVNIWLGWDVWDYSDMWGNILGQICPQFTLLWFPMILLAIVLDDVVRWKFYDEEKPRYKIGKYYIEF